MLLKTLCATAMAVAVMAPAHAEDIGLQTIPLGDGIRLAPEASRLLLPPEFRGLGCTFFADPNGGGDSMRVEVASLSDTRNGRTYYGVSVPWVGHDWNDRISSIRCDRSGSIGCYPVVYRDAVENQELFAPTSFGVDAGDLIELSRFGIDDAISALTLTCG